VIRLAAELEDAERNRDLGYNGHHLFAGFSYGVLFPFGAMSHPKNDAGSGGPGFPFNTATEDNTQGNTTAHTIQMRLILAF
jgi:hypothetical protein